VSNARPSLSTSSLRFGEPQIVAESRTPGVIGGYDVGPDGTSALVSRVSDPLLLRQEIRLWPGWDKTVRSGSGGGK